LLHDFSIEMTAKDVPHLEAAASLIPQGTKIPVTFLPGENYVMRVAAAKRVKELGFVPVPHISARRIASENELRAFLSDLREQVGTNTVFVIAGDPPQPVGPFEDALAVIKSGVLEEYGISRVGISGYPEGHPEIGNDKLWKAKKDKIGVLLDRGHDLAIVTQFSFDAQAMLSWVAEVRNQGISTKIRLGVPGPASVKRLLAFAARCGVGASTSVMKKYGISITKLLTNTGPDKLVRELARGLDPTVHGEVVLHFYPFGGLAQTAQWVTDFRAKEGRRSG
jgi:methylenetetrahydrofolate reductase (NADPH)